MGFYRAICILAVLSQATALRRTIITNKPEHYEVAASSSAAFRCDAMTDVSLELQIIWLKDGKPIDFQNQPRFQMANDNSLLISNTTVLDMGEYTCIAKTEIDEAMAQATLTVQDKPNPPELTSLECHRNVAIIKWKNMGDNRAKILRYTVQSSFTPDTWELASESVPQSERTWTVQLSPWANYTFRVIAWNKIGPSAPSGHSEVCTTQPDVPYKNPDNVQGRGNDPTNMFISWSKMPQIEHNGPGFHYLVSWRRDSTGQHWHEDIIRNWHQTEYIVVNTPTFVPYKIKVIAVNSKGKSNVAPVEVTGWSGEDTPTQAPSNFTLVEIISGTTALLSWNPVPPESLRGHFKGYKIQTWTDGDEENLKEILVKADATSALVSKFKPFKKNNARIMAFNGRYNGPPSEVISFVAPEGNPGTVKSFEAYPIGSSAMLLKWDKPVDENGVLTGYNIYYQRIYGTMLGPLQERRKKIDPSFASAKLAGLEPNTKYRIQISAETEAGEGEKYFIEQTTKSHVNTKPDIPVFSTYTQANKEGNTQILVRWQPSPNGHAGTHFIAWYRLKGHHDWSKTSEITEDDYVLLTGFEPEQVYEVKISAHDGEYFSFSDIQEVDTTLGGPKDGRVSV